MTLRVELKIIPFGVESDEYTIKTINISNLGKKYTTSNAYQYGVEVDKYKTREYDTIVDHDRLDGAEVLVRKVLDKLGY